MPAIAGKRFGPYEVIAPLGTGGMGEVYRARDTRLDRSVALKVLAADIAGDPAARTRFEREARAIAALDHPHICSIFDVGESEGTHFLVMPLLDGQTLAARLEKGPLPLEEALAIATQVADALDKAHRQGIVHRDLKPANIMLTKAGAKLLDFGLAKLRVDGPISMSTMGAGATTSAGTAQGTILGTLHYMAPEQVEGREADARSDIWALGVVLYEMVTGARPFPGETPASVIGAILKEVPAPLSAIEPMVPAGLDHVVQVSLDKDPDQRWQSAGDVARHLRWQAATRLAPGSEKDRGQGPSDGQRRRSVFAAVLPWLVAGAALAALALRGVSPMASVPLPLVRLELSLPSGVDHSTTNSQSIALSPDGTQIAFAAATDGLRRLYLRRLSESVAVPVNGTELANICAFSPNGGHLAVVTSGGALKIVSLRDRQVVTLAENVDYSVGGLAWGDDGRITFGRDSTLWQIPATGGNAEQVTSLDGDQGERLHAWPVVVEGGRTILYTVLTGHERTAMHIDAVRPGSSERRRVVENARRAIAIGFGQLLFFRDGLVLAAPFDLKRLEVHGEAGVLLRGVSVSQYGTPLLAASSTGMLAYRAAADVEEELVWVSRQGVEEPIARGSQFLNPRLAPEGNRVVAESQGELVTYDVARATLAPLAVANILGSSFAVWSPDRQRIAFRTLLGIGVLEPDTGSTVKLVAGTGSGDLPTSMTPDGRTLAFVRQYSNGGDVYVVGLDGSSPPRPIVDTPGYDGGATFSPDGRWLAYVTIDAGHRQVWVRPYPGPGQTELVASGEGTHPRWGPSGRELFYRDGDRMMAVDVSTSPRLTLSPPRELFTRRLSYAASQTIASYDVSPDGQRFLMVKDLSESHLFSVVLNWPEELKRQVPADAR